MPRPFSNQLHSHLFYVLPKFIQNQYKKSNERQNHTKIYKAVLNGFSKHLIHNRLLLCS